MNAISIHTVYRALTSIFVAAWFMLAPFVAVGQHEEVLLTFRHPAVGHVYVGSLYDYGADQTFLPLTELFSRLEINYQPDIKNFTVSGNFLSPNNPYTINLSAMQVQLGDQVYPLTPGDFRIGEMDFFLAPRVFEEIFGLVFTVNINHLVLGLETTHILPIQERKAREQARSRMEGREVLRENFPMGFDRKRSVLSGAMVDYAITGNYAGKNPNLSYTFSGGAELLGGDMQGTIAGFQSGGYSSYRTSNLRWRYAIRNNDFISGIMAGQLSTSGLQPYYIKGVAITNDPIEPRRMFETYVIDGNTEPESEVEIYVNERLIDYKRADELGYYRFNVPVTYGTTRIGLRIFTRSGEMIISEKQIQVPYTFLPRGVVTYNLQAGVTENFPGDTLQNRLIAHGNTGIGVTNWLTAVAGVQHLGDKFNREELFYYGSLSARIAKQYLINIDAAPDAFYRFTGSVMYTSNLSLNMSYTKFEGAGMFNARNANEEVQANVYLPFRILGMSTGLRLGGEHTIFESTQSTRLLTDLSARLGKVNLRLNYRDNIFATGDKYQFGEGTLTTALTYTVSRSPGVPVYARGMFVRGQTQYDVHRNQLRTTELHLSKTVFRSGRLNLGVIYNVAANMMLTQFGLTLDLKKVRSTTTVNTAGSLVSARQSLTGSIGYDMPNNHLTLNNRQQVGRSAASVLMFVDNNNSGKYDRGDQLLPYRAVKLDRTATMQVGRDSILRLTQLQSYYLYNLSINRNAIADPTLVPLKDNFAFVADPNQYKRIEIPFYRGGIIEGSVLIDRGGRLFGQGGLRLLLRAIGGDYETTVRTFSDGGFYVMDIPPGKYTLEVDPIQLEFLNARSKPASVEFEVKALADGDYLEGIEIFLINNE
jgi:hypothetical protein